MNLRDRLIAQLDKLAATRRKGDTWGNKRFDGNWVPMFREDAIITPDQMDMSLFRPEDQRKVQALFDQYPEGVPYRDMFYSGWDSSAAHNALDVLFSKKNTKGIQFHFEDREGSRYIGPGSVFRYVNHEIPVDPDGNPLKSTATVIPKQAAIDKFINPYLDKKPIATINNGVPYKILHAHSDLLFRPRDPNNPYKLTQRDENGLFIFDSAVETRRVSPDDPVFDNYDLIDIHTVAPMMTVDVKQGIHAAYEGQGYKIVQQMPGLDRPFDKKPIKGYDMFSVGAEMPGDTYQLSIGPVYSYRFEPTVVDPGPRGRQDLERLLDLGLTPVLRPNIGFSFYIARLNPFAKGGKMAKDFGLKNSVGLSGFPDLESIMNLVGTGVVGRNIHTDKSAWVPPSVYPRYTTEDHLRPMVELDQGISSAEIVDMVKNKAITIVGANGKQISGDELDHVAEAIDTMREAGRTAISSEVAILGKPEEEPVVEPTPPEAPPEAPEMPAEPIVPMEEEEEEEEEEGPSPEELREIEETGYEAGPQDIEELRRQLREEGRQSSIINKLLKIADKLDAENEKEAVKTIEESIVNILT